MTVVFLLMVVMMVLMLLLYLTITEVTVKLLGCRDGFQG